MARTKIRNKARGKKPWLSFFRRLLGDRRGNTLIIVGGALIPLTALIGSGIDMSRAYMAQSRLQNACDAGALAGRRAMTGNGVDATVKSEAQKFFNFNFRVGTNGAAGTAAFGAKGFVPVVDADPTDATTVRVNATTTIPTAVMQILGFTTLPISASCSAKQNFVNTDVVLVLDTTGSMDDKVSGVRKIDALQDAVLALYDVLAPVQQQLQSVSLRLRYAVVPYSTTTNVGKLLYASNSDWIRTDQKYQTCSSSFVRGVCIGTYSPQLPDVPHNANWFNNTWNGCIEERKTVTSINTSTDLTIPSGAWDLNMAMIPSNSNNDTKWGANDPVAEEAAANSDDARACPYAASRLKVWSRSDFVSYLPHLTPAGYTYHDTGMIWGMHMLDRTGIWAADNPTTYNNMPVSRYIIFMTDGIPQASGTAYTSWGVENYDKRVTGGAGNEVQRHIQRFKMMCNYAKTQQDVSIWVVGLDTAVNSDVASCADNTSQVSTASTRDELIQKFVQIGQNIGALRLTK